MSETSDGAERSRATASRQPPAPTCAAETCRFPHCAPTATRRPLRLRQQGAPNQPCALPVPHAGAENDLAVVRRMQIGDAAAQSEFGARLACVIRMLSAENQRLGGPLDAHDLDDVAQDVRLVILRKLDDYRGLGALEAWALQVCRLELRNAIRRRRRQPRNLHDASDLVPFDATEVWGRMVQRELLQRALARLGGIEARLVTLRHLEGIPLAELGARTGMSAAAAKSRYFRARLRLPRILAALLHADE